MSGKIHQLSKQVYDLIAAGEVVTSPLSVVKELVENSIDAGATRISIEIADGGISLIRVGDNGSGIAEDDLPLAFAAHATSKLSSAEELAAISTLGFRGEALASIAAVSKTTMRTKTADAAAASRMSVRAGEIERTGREGADIGTSVTVEELFFNVPARLKHIGSARAETTKIIDFVSRMAISEGNIAFRFTSNGELLFATRGDGDTLAAIATVYGNGVAENLFFVRGENNEAGLSLSGYISNPLGLRKTRKQQTLFVNARYVKNAVVDAALDRAYHEFAEPGRFPIAFLFLETPPAFVDVNVHPAKSEVAFENATLAGELVEKTVREGLVSEKSVPKLAIYNRGMKDETFRLTEGVDATGLPRRSQDSLLAMTEEIEVAGAFETTEPSSAMIATDGGDDDKLAEIDLSVLFAGEDVQPSEAREFPIEQKYEAETKEPPPFLPEKLEVIASLFATYLLATLGDNFYLIDQHAAHERVNYEKFMKSAREKEIEKQGLLTPYLFNVPAAAAPIFSEMLATLAQLGYEIDEFGDDGTYAARTFPAFIAESEGRAFLAELLSDIGDGEFGAGDFSAQNPAAFDRLVLRACKSSVKANDALPKEEIDALISDLAKCENPYTCPHGRPVFLKLSKQDIERLFKRA